MRRRKEDLFILLFVSIFLSFSIILLAAIRIYREKNQIQELKQMEPVSEKIYSNDGYERPGLCAY